MLLLSIQGKKKKSPFSGGAQLSNLLVANFEEDVLRFGDLTQH
jgi:hypothetical protein